MLEGIEVSKTVTADQDADVLGGTVNFKMKESGEGREGIGVSVLAQGGYNGLVNAHNKYNNYKYVGSIEGRFLDENRLGVFAQADFERRNLTSNEFGGAYTNSGNSLTDYITTGLNLNHIPRDRQRGNGTLVLDYRLPEGKIGLTNFFSSGVTDIRNRGEFYDINNNLHNYSLAYSRSTLNMITNILSVEHEIPLFHLTGRLSHTYSETKTPNDWIARFQQASAGIGQFLNKTNLNPLDIPRAAIPNPSATYITALTSNSSFSRERALTGSLDLETHLTISDDIAAILKFGGKYRHQTRSYIYDQYTGQGLGLGSARFVDSLIASQFASTLPYVNTGSIPIGPFIDAGFDYGKFLNGDYPMGFPLNYAMLSSASDFVKSRIGILAARNDIAYFHDAFNSTTSNYSGTEDLSAFYLMATINIGPEITVIPGVRYQNLNTEYTAPRGQQNTASGSGGPYFHYDTTLAVSHPYWLPDVIVRYKPLPWFDIRLSYSNTLAYPDYNAITPRIDAGTGGVISWNNFELVPSRSTNYDAYLSFYDNSIGLFTAGAFLKRITDLIYPWSFYTSDTTLLKKYFPPNLGATPTSGNYNILTYVNDSYRIDDWGIELDWQTHFWYLPHPLDGLVLNVNYTHVFSKAQYPFTDTRRIGRTFVYVDTSYTDRLLFQPNNIVNLSLGYDFEGFSARVSMLYQDEVFTGTNFWEQLRTSTSARTRWDLSVKQVLPWFGLQVFGDVNNLSSADDISVIHATSGVPQSQQSYGLTASLGLRCNF
jgi:TonB-dependent receptor